MESSSLLFLLLIFSNAHAYVLIEIYSLSKCTIHVDIFYLSLFLTRTPSFNEANKKKKILNVLVSKQISK